MMSTSSSEDDDDAAATVRNGASNSKTTLVVQNLRLDQVRSSSSSSSAEEEGEEAPKDRGARHSMRKKGKRKKRRGETSDSDGIGERAPSLMDEEDESNQSDDQDPTHNSRDRRIINGVGNSSTNQNDDDDDDDDEDDGIDAWRKSRLTSTITKPNAQDNLNDDGAKDEVDEPDNVEDEVEPRLRRPDFSSPSSRSSSSSSSEPEEPEPAKTIRTPLSFSFSEGPRAEAHERTIGIWNSHYSGLGSLVHPFISIVETISNHRVTFFCNMCQGTGGKHDQPKKRQIRDIKMHLLQRCSQRNVRSEESAQVNAALRELHQHYEEYVARGPALRIARERSRQKHMQDARRTLLKKAVAELFLVTELPRTKTNLQYVRSLSGDVLDLSNALELKTTDVDEVDLAAVHKRMREL